MSFFNEIRTVVFETYEKHTGTIVRLIAFGEDADTGAKYVADILEFDYANDAGKRWVMRVAADYTESSDTSVEYFFRMMPKNAFDTATNIEFDKIDTGRARKLQSRLVKAIDYAVAENAGHYY